MLAPPAEPSQHQNQPPRLDPLGIAVNVNLGFAYGRLGRFADAHAQLRKVLEIDPLNANAHGLIGELYSRAYGRLDLGVPWERRALKLDPGFAVPVRRLAIVQIDLGNDEEARRLLDAARAANAPWIDTVTAMYHETRGELSEAVASAERALARSDAELWRNSMSLVVLRNADIEAGRPEVALARFKRGRPELFGSTPPVIDARNADTAISVAQLLLTTGKTDEANELLVAVGAFLAPFSPIGAEGIGIARVRILALEGRRAEALRELEETVAIGWRGPYWRYARDRDPELAPIRDDPRFRAAFGRVERDIQAQRTRLAARPADAPLPLLATADLQLVRTGGT
jgi:tetratricopeptide (TPR) repeat protein